MGAHRLAAGRVGAFSFRTIFNFTQATLEVTVLCFRGSRFSALVILLIAGCGPSDADVSKKRLESMAGGTLKDVTPVSGKVTVDGEAKGGVNLYLYRADAAKGTAQVMDCRTKPDGTYCWTTHMSCDGIEPGEYKVAFRFVPKLKQNDSNEISGDVFKGKYADSTKSEFKLTVAKGTPQTDVNYELKSK